MRSAICVGTCSGGGWFRGAWGGLSRRSGRAGRVCRWWKELVILVSWLERRIRRDDCTLTPCSSFSPCWWLRSAWPKGSWSEAVRLSWCLCWGGACCGLRWRRPKIRSRTSSYWIGLFVSALLVLPPCGSQESSNIFTSRRALFKGSSSSRGGCANGWKIWICWD